MDNFRLKKLKFDKKHQILSNFELLTSIIANFIELNRF